MTDILNNECLDRSPCLSCPHRDMDKNKCSMLCLRLAAYNSGEPWEGKPLPYIAPQGKQEEIIKMEENKEPEVRDRQASQSSALAGESEVGNQDKDLCVMCHDPDKKVLNKRSQTCGACYQQWNAGKKDHPTLGKFTPILIKSKIKIPAKKVKAERAPKTTAKKELKIANESLLRSMTDKITEEIVAEIASERFVGKLETVRLDSGLVIDLDNFPKIKTAVYDTAEKYFVTPEHVIIGLLGEALAKRADVW